MYSECTLEEHSHQDTCYTEESAALDPVFLCGYGEHTHKEECFDQAGLMICTIPEHTHIAACITTDLDIPDWQRNPHMEMPETIIDGTAYIGTLEIPQLQLQLPLVSETTGPNLQKAPCRYSGSPYTGDLVLGAHNYDAHFGRLKKLSYGEELQVTDLDGNVFRYQVADIEILQPEQLEDLLAGGWPLTLYTCTPGGQSRVVVRCDTA